MSAAEQRVEVALTQLKNLMRAGRLQYQEAEDYILDKFTLTPIQIDQMRRDYDRWANR